MIYDMGLDKFATAINCIDGRTQFPVSLWVKENHSIDYVDVITEPGPDKKVSENQADKIEQIKAKVLISVNAHKSNLIVVCGHHDCAGNPVSKEEHISQIKKSVEIIKSWNLGVTVLGLWVNEKWSIEPIT